MIRLLAIDPGTTHSGFCEYRGGEVIDAGVLSNHGMLDRLWVSDADSLAVEMVASYGMAVGKEVFETCVWIGRFVEAWDRLKGCPLDAQHRLVYRKDVKSHLCGSMKAKDANVRQAVIDLYGGKAEAIGNVKKPGPLYAVKSHAWQALAVAITAAETKP